MNMEGDRVVVLGDDDNEPCLFFTGEGAERAGHPGGPPAAMRVEKVEVFEPGVRVTTLKAEGHTRLLYPWHRVLVVEQNGG